jgi:hypothetical protein
MEFVVIDRLCLEMHKYRWTGGLKSRPALGNLSLHLYHRRNGVWFISPGTDER